VPAPDALVVGLAGDTVQVSEVRAGAPVVLAGTPITRGETHLVAATIGVAADGTPQVTLAVDDRPATDPAPLATPLTGASLTVGARPAATAATATVDEVTVLAGGLDRQTRGALLAADRWWSPAARTVQPA
jgi:hypothetical protein